MSLHYCVKQKFMFIILMTMEYWIMLRHFSRVTRSLFVARCGYQDWTLSSMCTSGELLALNRNDVTVLRAVRKVIFSLRLWRPVRQRVHSRCVNRLRQLADAWQ